MIIAFSVQPATHVYRTVRFTVDIMFYWMAAGWTAICLKGNGFWMRREPVAACGATVDGCNQPETSRALLRVLQVMGTP